MNKISFGGVQPNPKESKMWLHPHNGLKTYNLKKLEWTGGGSSNDTPIDEPESLYEFVDLGLPSGLLWATTNVGATKPEESGLYFQWGDTQGYKVTLGELLDEGQAVYSIESMEPEMKQFAPNYSDCKFYNTENSSFIKYNDLDGLTTLELSDDAANADYSKMRIPTKEECEELLARTTSAWTDNYNGTNVKGYVFTSKVDKTKSIFVPCVGFIIGGTAAFVGIYNGYTSSSLSENSDNNYYCLFLSSDGSRINANNRFMGQPVRGVQDPK